MINASETLPKQPRSVRGAHGGRAPPPLLKCWPPCSYTLYRGAPHKKIWGPPCKPAGPPLNELIKIKKFWMRKLSINVKKIGTYYETTNLVFLPNTLFWIHRRRRLNRQRYYECHMTGKFAIYIFAHIFLKSQAQCVHELIPSLNSPITYADSCWQTEVNTRQLHFFSKRVLFLE